MITEKLRRLVTRACFDSSPHSKEELDRSISPLEWMDLISSCPDDLRAKGWAVAAHNDYQLQGESFTFWLLTKGECALKGEGRTDGEALNVIRQRLLAIEEHTDDR